MDPGYTGTLSLLAYTVYGHVITVPDRRGRSWVSKKVKQGGVATTSNNDLGSTHIRLADVSFCSGLWRPQESFVDKPQSEMPTHKQQCWLCALKSCKIRR